MGGLYQGNDPRGTGLSYAGGADRLRGSHDRDGICDVPNWAPLEAVGEPELCCEFMWMLRQCGIESFKHTFARGAPCSWIRAGRCYRQTTVGIDSADLDTEHKSTRGE